MERKLSNLIELLVEEEINPITANDSENNSIISALKNSVPAVNRRGKIIPINQRFEKALKVLETFGATKIAAGSTRTVFDIGDGKVLKLSNGETKFGEQNKNEYNFYQNCIKEHKQYFSITYPEHDENFLWIISEKVRDTLSEEVSIEEVLVACLRKMKLTTSMFEELCEKVDRVGGFYSFAAIMKFAIEHPNGLNKLTANVIVNAVEKQGKIRNPVEYIFIKLFERSDWFRGLAQALAKCNIHPTDLHEENWGLRLTNGDPVILDYGYEG
jgi:hypothetical protein